VRIPVVALCRPEVATGFLLAGLDVRRARDAGVAAAALAELRRDVGHAIVLVQDILYDELDARQLKRDESALLVVPFPDPVWEEEPSAAEEYLVEMLRRAVGYRVRLR
jgi:vacuolar-type H+-ATPase subunit F/Vma7